MYIKMNLLQNKEKMIIEVELNELVINLNNYNNVFQVLKDYQDLWAEMNFLFSDLDVQTTFRDENKRFRE